MHLSSFASDDLEDLAIDAACAATSIAQLVDVIDTVRRFGLLTRTLRAAISYRAAALGAQLTAIEAHAA